MAAASYLPSEDQSLCSICLDVFTDPVTIPRGHNFCKDCITEHWDTEISELKKRSAKVEHLSRSEDHLHVLQSVKTLNIQHPSPTKDWTKVSIPPSSYEGNVDKAVAQLEQTLTELRKLLEAKLKDVQKYARGIWIAWLRNGNEYKALDDPPVRLSLKSRPQKVGVFVDYEEGLVSSFYDVDAAALIYSFTGCSFTEKLFPYFSSCENDGTQNSSPLIISPVRVN
ncbi:hypothetical protein CesoFtcFv8_008446 [Champsocephalus esox]|uniref:B30.2/SPRY domain-containing protein n=1 Tax=Champsocephalus esox TaxID=159716 RepID=A0AAN8H1C7_9TELE|nr:hypothetical protein CesoFtcFv8_008446 [Champsocephalus esox]